VRFVTLWGPKRQATYIFERDKHNRSRCYGDCAELWPPIYTTGKPSPAEASAALSSAQPADAAAAARSRTPGKPLYYYAHERRGQVCWHRIELNGGRRWLIGPNGRRRP
jgi:predicted lipoprotein with Yx(FWY)xxD motif